MDNVKMGDVIRTARKKKGLTQKDIATHLHITDRAVSKWERGICAPDLALLEPLAEILEISITELLTGEEEFLKEHKKEIDLVVKETIQYSKQEATKKDKKNRIKIIYIILVSILLLVSLILFLLHKGFFHKIGTYPSPDGSTIVTVYDCHLEKNGFPTDKGFAIDITGKWEGRQYYTSCKFKGTWWSPDDINFEFLQWSEKDPSVMLIYFNYNDANGNLHDGYVWYDWETLQISGEMELKQDKKEATH